MAWSCLYVLTSVSPYALLAAETGSDGALYRNRSSVMELWHRSYQMTRDRQHGETGHTNVSSQVLTLPRSRRCLLGRVQQVTESVESTRGPRTALNLRYKHGSKPCIRRIGIGVSTSPRDVCNLKHPRELNQLYREGNCKYSESVSRPLVPAARSRYAASFSLSHALFSTCDD